MLLYNNEGEINNKPVPIMGRCEALAGIKSTRMSRKITRDVHVDTPGIYVYIHTFVNMYMLLKCHTLILK